MNSHKVIQKKPEDTEQADYILIFNYYQLFGKVYLEYLVFVFEKQGKKNNMYWYLEKVYFLA